MEDTKSYPEAESDLRSWARRHRSVAADRSRVVAAALGAGMSKEEVHVITGLGRTTIDRIIAKGDPK